MPSPGLRRFWWSVVAIALVFLAAHLPFLARTPDDIDAVNFTLGVRAFDVAHHQPHPPGYPVIIALGKAGVAVARQFRVTRAHAIPEARVLAFWSALFGAIAIVSIAWFFQALERQAGRATAAAVLLAAAPLYWFTAVRPLSDLPGLAVAFLAVALFAHAIRRQQVITSAEPLSESDRRVAVVGSGRLIVAGAAVAGFAIGFRAQAAWLTIPMLVFAILNRVGRGAAGALLGATMTFTLGVAIWALPLISASGGLERYLTVVSKQAGEDMAGVDMFILRPGLRRLAFGLIDTFISPWTTAPLAIVVLVLAAIGASAMLLRARTGLAILLTATVPYALFHLLFQETVTTRYALPILPAVAYLAVRGADVFGRRVMIVTVAAVATVSLVPTVVATARYGSVWSPLFQAIEDVRRVRDSTPDARLAMHYGLMVASRSRVMPLTLMRTAPKVETRELSRFWAAGGRASVWFLADPKRTDLATVDPASRHLVATYRWPFDEDAFMKGARPGEVDCYRIDPPGWFVGEGWSLTPELAGIAPKQASMQHSLRAFARSRPERAVLMIGGRHLGGPHDPPARFTVTVAEAAVDTWTAPPGFFLRFVTLPPGSLTAGESEYVPIRIVAEPADMAGGPLRTALEQFDLQSGRAAVYGFDGGWHEQEYNPSTGRTWRWTSRQARTRVHNAGRDLALRISGESPLRYFTESPQVTVRAGDQVLARVSPADDFNLRVRVPADALERAGGIVILETDRTFTPVDRGVSRDRRPLGLRIYSFELR